jgi:hypothetical protein
MARKEVVKEVGVTAVETLPAGVKVIDGEPQPLDAASIRLVMKGWEVKKQIDSLKKQLDEIHQQLIEAHGTGCALVVTGICRASLALRENVTIADVERLKAVLGFRFTDLVKTEVSYKPEAKLIEMACNADEAMQPAIAACLKVGKSESVTWRAEK